MTYGSFLYPPHIHLEQEDPLNLDEENDVMEVSLLNNMYRKPPKKILAPIGLMRHISTERYFFQDFPF